jgi:hypothetical protein
VLRIFIAHKNPSSSAGFEPANLGSSDNPKYIHIRVCNVDSFVFGIWCFDTRGAVLLSRKRPDIVYDDDLRARNVRSPALSYLVTGSEASCLAPSVSATLLSIP